ncbi:MAG: dihydrolipoamide acetyltransferase family protein, partial [Streptosporangiaceae bacterium]
MPDVLMPRLSDTMEEGVLSQWVKHEGDQVRKGDVLAVIETDKAAMEMEAYDDGVLTRILVREGESAPIGTPIAVIGGEGASEAAAQPPIAASEQPERVVMPPPAPASPSEVPAASRAPASPLARKLARERGIDLSTLSGSGPSGRIVRADIEEAARARDGGRPAPSPAEAPGGTARRAPAGPVQVPAASTAPRPAPRAVPAAVVEADVEAIPLSTVRRLTAQRLAASARDAPHFYLTIVADAGELLEFREQASRRPGADVKVSVTDVLVKACATALAAHPEVNASWDVTRILRHHRVGIGIAVAIEDGLIVPVIRDADRKTLSEVAREAH